MNAKALFLGLFALVVSANLFAMEESKQARIEALRQNVPACFKCLSAENRQTIRGLVGQLLFAFQQKEQWFNSSSKTEFINELFMQLHQTLWKTGCYLDIFDRMSEEHTARKVEGYLNLTETN